MTKNCVRNFLLETTLIFKGRDVVKPTHSFLLFTYLRSKSKSKVFLLHILLYLYFILTQSACTLYSQVAQTRRHTIFEYYYMYIYAYTIQHHKIPTAIAQYNHLPTMSDVTEVISLCIHVRVQRYEDVCVCVCVCAYCGEHNTSVTGPDHPVHVSPRCPTTR
uniref:Uncharacterized protein n=1 Tax=Schizaphis graminum TaxID=13262 RepID=A0A2S2NYN2_SCHGA